MLPLLASLHSFSLWPWLVVNRIVPSLDYPSWGITEHRDDISFIFPGLISGCALSLGRNSKMSSHLFPGLGRKLDSWKPNFCVLVLG